MKRALMVGTLLMALVAAPTYATTPAEHLAVIHACDTGVEAQTYWATIPAEELTDYLTYRVCSKFIVTKDWQGLYDFPIPDTNSKSVWVKLRALFELGRSAEALVIIESELAATPTGLVASDNVQYRHILTIYLREVSHGRVSAIFTPAETADKLAVALKLPTDRLNERLKELIREWQTYSRFATEVSSRELYNYLEYENKPNINSAKAAMWWGIHVTSKAQ